MNYGRVNFKGESMAKKCLGMKRPINQFYKALKELFEYIAIFENMPPRGEIAKEQAIKEWKQCFNNALIQFNNIRNTQIDLLERKDD